MSAIITKQFRVNNAKNFIQSSDNLYAFIGRNEEWTVDSSPPTVIDTASKTIEADDHILAMKKVLPSGFTHLIPRVNWVYGGTYNAWNDNIEGLNNFYVLTEESEGENTSFNVYKCLYAPYGVQSTVKPNHLPTDLSSPSNEIDPDSLVNETSDGYVWQYMYTLENTEFNFVTNSFIPVKSFPEGTTLGSLTLSDQVKYKTIEAAKELIGRIYNVEVLSGGSGYTSATVTINGDGTGATATAIIDGGSISRIIITNPGVDYTFARIEITGDGTGATAYAVLNKVSDPVIELGGYYVGIQTTLSNSTVETDELNLATKFRQIGLINEPKSGGSISAAPKLTACHIIEINPSNSDPWTIGSKVEGDTTGAQGIICSATQAGSPEMVYVHIKQTPNTGYTDFSNSEDISIISGGTSAYGTINNIIQRTYDRYSGNIIFLENKEPIQRNPSQSEDLRIVIEF